MLSLKVGGEWLSSISAYGPVTVEFGVHGSEAASWEMAPNVRHPALRAGRSVEVYDGPRIWVGTLNEPGSGGQYSAKGIWRQAEDVPALDILGARSTVPDDIIAGSFARGDISWTLTNSLSDTPFAATGSDLSLSTILSGLASELGTRWVVTPDYRVILQADPTTPMWHVPHAVAGRGLTPAEDEFATHLVGSYLLSAGVFDTETVGSDDAAEVFGRRPVPVDLVPLGFIDSVKATAMLTGMFLRAGARMGWAEGLELASGQITNPGGIAATLSQVQALQMVRLCGTVDASRPYIFSTHTDIVILGSKYTDGSRTITLEPAGYAPRTLGDVLDVGMAA